MPRLNDRVIIHALYWDRIYVSQKKAILLIRFKEQNTHTFPVLLKSKNRKFIYKIRVKNCLFTGKYVNNKFSPIFNSWLIFPSTSHNYETSFATQVQLEISTITTTTYGNKAFINMAAKLWNNITHNKYFSILSFQTPTLFFVFN